MINYSQPFFNPNFDKEGGWGEEDILHVDLMTLDKIKVKKDN